MIARLNGNRRSARAQAAFVALLYVFLSTFGMLTHTHARICSDLNESRSAVSSSAERHMVAQHRAPCAPDCAFCNWQANSVSTALPVQQGTSPCLTALTAPRQIVLSVTARIVQTSSRAPPSA